MNEAIVNLEALKEMRDMHGYSISDIALHLGYKTPTGYWLVEKGERSCSVSVLYALAKLYDLQMEDLVLA